VADVTVDAVDILDSGHTTGGFTELEIELVDGDDDDLARLGRALRRAGAHRSDGRPKLMRVLDLADAGEPASDEPALEHVRALLLAQLHAIEGHDPGVRLGDDAEDVHRMRVATRRTRALIRATKPLLGDHLSELGTELKWLASLLGDVRDLDVLLAHIRAEVAKLDVDRAAGNLVVTALEAERDDRRRELLEALDSERYLQLLGRFAQAVDSLPPLDAPEGLDPLAARPAKKLERATKRLPDEPSDAQLHDLRKRAKKARYAAELAAVAGRKPVARYVDALKDLQDVVGEHQDAVVAEERLRALAAPVSALAVGRLVERERARRAQARTAYPAVLEKALAGGRKALLK
jgi:CHAD domain-containing protein